MHPLVYNDVPTEVHSAPIFNVRRTNQKVQPKTLKLSLDQLQMHSKLHKGAMRREIYGSHQENIKILPNSPLSLNTPRAKLTHDALPKHCVENTQNRNKESNRIIRKSPSCLSVRLLKNAVKRTCRPMEKTKTFHPNEAASMSVRSPHLPKSSQSAIRIQENVRLVRPHSKLSCISNEMKSAATSSTSRSDDQIVLHSTKRLFEPTHSSQYSGKLRQNQNNGMSCGLKKRSSSLSVCSHATELAMIIPEISVETNLNCTSRSETQHTNRSNQSIIKLKLAKTEDDDKPICISQHSIRLRSHDAHKPTVGFGRRMRVPRADLSRIRVSEAPGLKALDQPVSRQCDRKRKIFQEIGKNAKISQVTTSNSKSDISYMFLYISILCGIGLMMLAYYL